MAGYQLLPIPWAFADDTCVVGNQSLSLDTVERRVIFVFAKLCLVVLDFDSKSGQGRWARPPQTD